MSERRVINRDNGLQIKPEVVAKLVRKQDDHFRYVVKHGNRLRLDVIEGSGKWAFRLIETDRTGKVLSVLLEAAGSDPNPDI